MSNPSPETHKVFAACRKANRAGQAAARACAGHPYEDRVKNPYATRTLERAAWFAGYDAEALKRAAAWKASPAYADDCRRLGIPP